MIQSFFKQAAAGRPVYLTDVREAFRPAAPGTSISM